MCKSTSKFLLWVLLIFLFLPSCRQKIDLEDLNFLEIKGDSLLSSVFNDVEKYELQIRYVKVDRLEDGGTRLTPYEYRVDSTKYFYPASTVKMPVAFLALEKLNSLRKEGVNIDFNSPLEIDSVRSPQSPVLHDSSSLSSNATIAHYIHKLFIVSDNDAYNRLYEFVGPEEINRSLRKKRIFGNSRIVHRVGISGFSPEENLHTNPFRFYSEGELTHQQGPKEMQSPNFEPLEGDVKGAAYIDAEGKKVEEPFDFSKKNYVSIKDLQESMISVMLEDGRFDLSKEDYELLYTSMSIFPGESVAPVYDNEHYYDSYVKFFMFGDSKEDIPDNIRIFNKVGLAYGYLTDCAYVVDFENDVEFFLAATIHVNENQTYNDGIYEYDELGVPFLARLGQVFYEYEKTRKRSYLPDLDRFKMTY